LKVAGENRTMRSPPAIPAVEEVQQLPLLRELTVPREYEDFNGHMSITHHLGIHDASSMPFFALLGIDESYFAQGRGGIVDLENHLCYYAEVHVGDRVAVHARFLARSAKALHSIWFLLNLTRGQLANTLEAVSVHIDPDARRTSALPDALTVALDRWIDQHRALTWEPPVCGFMGVR
jgi:acyl-CoA thioester hydrolase